MVNSLWPHRADMPQLYNDDYERYIARGGIVGLDEFTRDFVANTRRQISGEMVGFYPFSFAFDHILKDGVAGDLAELGVHEGDTARLLAKFARITSRTAYLLDTFEDFHRADLADVDAGQSHQFVGASLEAVREKVGAEAVHFIKGPFPETAGQLPPDGRYSLVHIDCDLYAPIIAGLRYFIPA